MRKVQHTLLAIVITTCALVVMMAILFECDVFASGLFAHDKTEFGVAVILEITTLLCIPLALRLFKFKKIHRSLINGKEKTLAKWGVLRLSLLCVPLLANALCYWLFMAPTFAYMAIMLFICLFFVFPTMERCVAETVNETAE